VTQAGSWQWKVCHVRGRRAKVFTAEFERAMMLTVRAMAGSTTVAHSAPARTHLTGPA